MKIHYAITVGLRFQPSDAPLLEIAKRNHKHSEANRKMFHHAASSAMKGTPLVVQCMTKEELQRVMATFPQVGVKVPTLEELRTEELRV